MLLEELLLGTGLGPPTPFFSAASLEGEKVSQAAAVTENSTVSPWAQSQPALLRDDVSALHSSHLAEGIR